MGTAIIGLLGTGLSLLSDKSQSQSEAEIDAFMNQNKALLSSNVLPIAVMGTVFVGGMLAIVAIRKGQNNA